MWCTVLQCVVVCCMCCSVLQGVTHIRRQLGVGVWYSALQYVTVCCSVVQCVAVWCSVLQCGAVCCSVVQCRRPPFHAAAPIGPS